MNKSSFTYKEILRRIHNGIYRPGEKLPGEIAFAEELGISRVTLRIALKQLVSEGIVESYGRSGNYVSMNIPGKRFLLLIGGSTEQLGIVEQYLSSLLRQNLANAGHQLELLAVSALENISLEEWNAMLAESRIEGVFLGANYTPEDSAILHLFNHTTVPMIAVHGCEKSSIYHFPKVSGGGKECFMDGVRYLASLGHRRICTIFSENNTRGIELELYREFLQCNGLSDDPGLIMRLSLSETKTAVRRQLLGPEPPTAFMCFCDARAMQVYAAARELGMRIPGQISVMGMSGYSERLFAMPRLSMANFRYDLICAEAVKLMLRSAEWFGPGMEKIYITVPHSIEPYGSTGPVPGGVNGELPLTAVSRIFSTGPYITGEE